MKNNKFQSLCCCIQQTTVQIAALIATLCVLGAVDAHRDQASSANSINGRQASFPLRRRASTRNDNQRAVYFLSAVSARDRRVQRSVNDNDGSGSEELDLDFSTSLLSGNEDVIDTTTSRFPASKNATTSATVVNFDFKQVLSITPVHNANDNHTQEPSESTNGPAADGGIKLNDTSRTVTDSRPQHADGTVTAASRVLVTVQSSEGSTDDANGDRREGPAKGEH